MDQSSIAFMVLWVIALTFQDCSFPVHVSQILVLVPSVLVGDRAHRSVSCADWAVGVANVHDTIFDSLGV